MKTIYFSIAAFLIFSFAETFAQVFPDSYSLNQQNKKMSKVSSPQSISSNGINDIITCGDTIWVGTNNGVSLSTDNGNTWTSFTKEFNNLSVSAIGYYKGVFWAALANSFIIDGREDFKGDGLTFTSDLGKSWTYIPQPKDSTVDTLVVYGIDTLYTYPHPTDEEDVVWDIAFTPHAIWIAAWGAGLRRSFDMGKTWQRVVLPPDYLDSINPYDTLDFCLSPYISPRCKTGNSNHQLCSIAVVNDSTLYVGTINGIDKTTNAESLYPSWVKFNHQNQWNSFPGDWVMQLAYDRLNNTIWAACWQGPDETEKYGVSFSTDGGASWHATLLGQKVYNFAFKNSEVIAPSDNGAFGTEDNGLTWILPGTIQDEHSKLNLSTDAFYSAGFSNNYTWLGSGEGLARLQNNGSGMWQGTWKVYFVSQPLSSNTDTYAYPNPFNPRTDILKIKYSTNGSEQVTIRILNFSMQIVKTIIENANRGNPTHVIDSPSGTIDYWDGTDQAGNMVPNGVYFYRVDVGLQKPAYGKILVVY